MNGFRLAVVGLNSSWLQYKEGDLAGTLYGPTLLFEDAQGNMESPQLDDQGAIPVSQADFLPGFKIPKYDQIDMQYYSGTQYLSSVTYSLGGET